MHFQKFEGDTREFFFFFVFYLFLVFYSFYKYTRYITNFYMHKFTLHYSITQRKYHYTGLREYENKRKEKKERKKNKKKRHRVLI